MSEAVPDILFSKLQTIWVNGGFVEGYTIHTTRAGDGVPEGYLRQIGYVWRTGEKQRGRWAAQRSIADDMQFPFPNRTKAGLFLRCLDKAADGKVS